VALLSLPTATFTVTSSSFRVQVEARIEPQQIGHQVEALLQRSEGSVRIIAWRQG
jgi:hypothetical protein